VLKAGRCVKVYGQVKVKGSPKYGLIKKFKMDLMKVSRDKDPELIIIQFLFLISTVVLSMHF
jgi:hypothetical protein